MKTSMRQPDAIIVGGGIQGAMLALAAAERGLNTIVIECNELGAGASGNSYGIVHGGLRYLQALDIPRWKRSKDAQAWYLQHFPELVRPLRCVMPLYRWRLRSALLFRLAILLDALLIRAFKITTPLSPTTLISASEIKQDYPFLPASGLSGAACWHDAEVSNMPALIHAVLQKAGLEPAAVMTGVEATELLVNGDKVTGVRIKNKTTGEITEIASDVVINCAGAWSGKWQHGVSTPSSATLAFNLLLDLPALGTGKGPDTVNRSALALSMTPGKGRSYFMRPVTGGMFAGTFYKAAPGMVEPQVSDEDIRQFLSDLDQAYPGLGIQDTRVLDVTAGLLPDKDGSGTHLSSREHILEHGPKGFFTVLGSKFTTAPMLARDAAERIWPGTREAATGIHAELAKQHV